MAKKTHTSSAAARDAILDAAEKIIVNVGPAGMRISAVAKQANMAHPNIIHHFGSREGLLNAIAQRVSDRSAARITAAISAAQTSADEDRLHAVTQILDSVYEGDQGKLAVWMHLSGNETAIKQNMPKVVAASRELRASIHGDAKRSTTERLVLLINLALIGEVVAGRAVKQALGYGEGDDERAYFKQWLAELLLNLSDQEFKTSLDHNRES